MSGPDSGVRLDGLTVGYRSGSRLRRRAAPIAGPLDAQARRGELTMLLGPNGTGKSTLIRTLCGLQPALDGRVWLDGTDLAALTADQVARTIAVVLTERIDPGFLSARELAGLGRIPHIGFGARLGPADREIVEWALRAVGADHLADRPAAELSDGERQRVLTARALAQQPDLLILDEPTAFLDVPSRAALTALLHRLARETGIAVVMSTHDLESALRSADRLWLMDADGTLHADVPETIASTGLIGTVFDGPATRFDPEEGAFVLVDDDADRYRVRLDVPAVDRPMLLRQCARESCAADLGDGAGAQTVITGSVATGLRVHRPGVSSRAADLSTVPVMLRDRPDTGRRLLGDAAAAELVAALGEVSPYFRLEIGGATDSLAALYADDRSLAAQVERVGTAMGVTEFRTAASTLFIGMSARLWSMAVGALVLADTWLDLDAATTGFGPGATGPALRTDRPICWGPADGHGPGPDERGARGPAALDADVAAALTDVMFTAHLDPLAQALARIGSVSAPMLRGNIVATVFGAGRVLDRHLGSVEPPRFGVGGVAAPVARPGPGWRSALQICRDARLADALAVDAHGGYRRRSCCLYYRAPGGGLCGDCVLDTPPDRRRRPATAVDEGEDRA